MTDDKIALRELLQKGSHVTFLREVIGIAAQRLMEVETGMLCGTAHASAAPIGRFRATATAIAASSDRVRCDCARRTSVGQDHQAERSCPSDLFSNHARAFGGSPHRDHRLAAPRTVRTG